MEHYKHYYQGKGFTALLHAEMIGEDNMNFKLQGDPVIVSKMIRNAMEAKQDICAAMIAAVMSWAKDHNIEPQQLAEMVKFHKR